MRLASQAACYHHTMRFQLAAFKGGAQVRKLLAVLSLSVALGAVVGIACFQHEDESVTYENATAVTVTIVSDGAELITLLPGEMNTNHFLRKQLMPDHIEAFDQSGTLLFDRTYTWEDVEEAGWRIVITAGDIAPE